MSRAILLFTSAVLVGSIVFAPGARAAFVNGVETFQGGLDLNTWERYQTVGLSTGADGLSIRVLNTSNEITTRFATVGVGQSVHADIRVNGYPQPDNGLSGEVGLYLSTNTTGPSGVSSSDSEYLAIVSVDVFDQIIAWHSDGIPITGLRLLDRFQPAGTTYRYRITRLSHDSARYEVIQGNQVLGTMVRTFNEVPDDLYVSIWANGIDVTVRNVTIVPEPGPLVLLAAFPLLRRRRQ